MKNKRSLLHAIGLALALQVLAACGAGPATPTPAPTATPAPDPAAETHRLVQGWVDAYHAKDADKFMSFFAEDAVYLDTAIKDFGTFSRDSLDRMVHSTFQEEGFKIEVTSFFVSPDGKFAVAQGSYYDLNKAGKQVAMPVAMILEIRDGKIIKETDYYDRGPVE
ncbi:MAG: nuclear transport factor 2 family protein [Bacteroidota bacterium]